MKKGKFKEKFKENLGDAALELVLTLILLIIGVGVLALFGIEADCESMDPDLVALIGLGALAAAGAVIVAAVILIKKFRKGKAADGDHIEPPEKSETEENDQK